MKVREAEAKLDPATYIVMLAIPSRGITRETTTVTDPFSAAQLMVNGTHRLATKAEIDSYHKAEDELAARNLDAEKKRNLKHQIIVNNTLDESLLTKLTSKKKGE